MEQDAEDFALQEADGLCRLMLLLATVIAFLPYFSKRRKEKRVSSIFANSQINALIFSKSIV